MNLDSLLYYSFLLGALYTNSLFPLELTQKYELWTWTQSNLFLFTSWQTSKVTRQALTSSIVLPISEVLPFVYRRPKRKLLTECRSLFFRASEWIDKIESKVCLTPKGQKGWIIDGETIVTKQAYDDNSLQYTLFSGELHTLHIGNLY